MPRSFSESFVQRVKSTFLAALRDGKKPKIAAKLAGIDYNELAAWAHYDRKFSADWDRAVGRDPERFDNQPMSR